MDTIPKDICIVDFNGQWVLGVIIVLNSMLSNVTSTGNIATRQTCLQQYTDVAS